MNKQEWEDKLAEVQKHSEHWYNKYKELENKIADIKANCDLAIEGRDIKIKELEQQIEKMKCCRNCEFDNLEPPEVISNGVCENCINHSKWELEY